MLSLTYLDAPRIRGLVERVLHDLADGLALGEDLGEVLGAQHVPQGGRRQQPRGMTAMGGESKAGGSLVREADDCCAPPRSALALNFFSFFFETNKSGPLSPLRQVARGGNLICSVQPRSLSEVLINPIPLQ